MLTTLLALRSPIRTMMHATTLFTGSLLLAAPLFAQIAPGSLAVVRVGTGAAALSSASTATFVDLFTTAGAPAGTSLALPTAASGANQPLTNSGTATSEGFVTQSVDGRYLLLAGYAAIPGTASVVGSASATTARVVARIALDGTIDTTTALADAYSGGNIRSAGSTDGLDLWTTGSNAGVRYATFGGTTSVGLLSTPTNIRVVGIAGGQLYASSATGTFQGVSTIGTGLPNTAGQTMTLLPGFPTASGPSAYDFFVADANTIYVADDRTVANGGGIQKWVQAGGTWTLAYTMSTGLGAGCRGLGATVEAGVVTLYATTAVASANALVTVTDAGAASPFTTLATAPANTAFRGVRWVRTPANVVHSGAGCPTTLGLPVIGTNGAPVTGNLGFQITASNNPPLSLAMFSLNAGPAAPVGLPIPGAPACALLYVNPLLLLAELIDPAGNCFTAVPIPASASLGGFQLSAQVFPFDLALVGASLKVGATDALEITVGN